MRSTTLTYPIALFLKIKKNRNSKTFKWHYIIVLLNHKFHVYLYFVGKQISDVAQEIVIVDRFQKVDYKLT
jgi:hypothetical protein